MSGCQVYPGEAHDSREKVTPCLGIPTRNKENINVLSKLRLALPTSSTNLTQIDKDVKLERNKERRKKEKGVWGGKLATVLSVRPLG